MFHVRNGHGKWMECWDVSISKCFTKLKWNPLIVSMTKNAKNGPKINFSGFCFSIFGPSVAASLYVVVVMGNGELGLLKAEVSPATWCLPYWNGVFRLSLVLILPPSMRGKLLTVGTSATPVFPVAKDYNTSVRIWLNASVKPCSRFRLLNFSYSFILMTLLVIFFCDPCKNFSRRESALIRRRSVVSTQFST